MRRLIAAQTATLVRSPFVRVVSGMMAYTAIGQGLYMLSAPFLGRLYTPEEIGTFGLFLTIAATAAGFVCLLYDYAIPAARTDEDAQCLTIGAGLVAVLTCSLMGIVISVLSWQGLGGMGALPVWAGALMAALLLVQGAIQIGQAWLIRRHDTLMIGRSNLTLNIGRGVGQVGGGWALSTWWVLVLGELAGRVVSLVQIARHLPRAEVVRRATWGEIAASLKRYREFPIVLLPAQGLDALVIVTQVSGLALLFGPVALGQYYLMRRTLDLPVAFVFRSLSDVFYGRLAEYSRSDPDRIRPFFTRAFFLLLGAGLLAGLPVMLFGPLLFRLVYGPGWEVAGSLAAVMLPAAILNLAVAPISRIFALTSKPHLRFSLGIISAIGTAATLFLAHRLAWDLTTTTIGLSTTISLSYVGYFIAGYLASGSIRPNPDSKSDMGAAEIG